MERDTTTSKPSSAPDAFSIATALFVAAILAISYAAGEWGLSVYALSFWYYLVYALAFFWRRVPLERFKRDSMVLKTVSLIALGFVLWSVSPNALSLVVTAAGFALNISAFRALGPDRTYYGFELGGIPAKRVTSFPFNVLSHPMLIGNMVAYGGPLIDETFREEWWPLAAAHVLLNLLVLLMEARARSGATAGALWTGFILIAGSVLFVMGFTLVWQFAFSTVVMGFVFAAILYRRYAMEPRKTD